MALAGAAPVEVPNAGAAATPKAGIADPVADVAAAAEVTLLSSFFSPPAGAPKPEACAAPKVKGAAAACASR